MKVISKPMYDYKTEHGESAHCKHTNHMFMYLMRVAGGAPDGVPGAISAPYFDPTVKQVFPALKGYMPNHDRPGKMPSFIQSEFEARGWMVGFRFDELSS